LRGSFNQEALITLYASLRFSQYVKLAQHFTALFGSTHACDQAFFTYDTKQIISVRSRLTDVHLHDLMGIGFSEMEPNVKFLAKQRVAQVSH
jgi:hypothetical protein